LLAEEKPKEENGESKVEDSKKGSPDKGKGKKVTVSFSIAESIGFPRDKFSMKRLEDLIRVITTPKHRSSGSVTPGKKQTTLDAFGKGDSLKRERHEPVEEEKKVKKSQAG